MDAAWMKKKDHPGFMPPGRPKKWRDQCFKVLEQSIAAKYAVCMHEYICGCECACLCTFVCVYIYWHTWELRRVLIFLLYRVFIVT